MRPEGVRKGDKFRAREEAQYLGGDMRSQGTVSIRPQTSADVEFKMGARSRSPPGGRHAGGKSKDSKGAEGEGGKHRENSQHVVGRGNLLQIGSERRVRGTQTSADAA